MKPFSFVSSAILATAAAATALGGVAMSAHAAPPVGGDPQSQINTQLHATQGGTQISRNEVAYDGGKVVMSFPDTPRGAAPDYSRARAGVHGCPSGWYCFYQYQNYGGRRLQFHDCDTIQYFSRYNFKNQASGWVNTTAHYVLVYDQPTKRPVYLWTEAPRSSAARVPSSADNKADSFATFC